MAKYNVVSNIREVNEDEAAAVRSAIGSSLHWTPAAEKAMWNRIGVGTTSLSTRKERQTEVEFIEAELEAELEAEYDDACDDEPSESDLIEIDEEVGV